MLQLADTEEPFPYFLDVVSRDIRYKENISVLSLQNGMGGVLDFSCQSSSIFMFDSDTTLCRAQYYAADGLSGSAVITEVESDGKVKVVGVHVATRDATEKVEPIERVSKKSKAADFESVSSSSRSLSKNIHGHIAYCMICIASKVDGLLGIIQGDVPVQSAR